MVYGGCCWLASDDPLCKMYCVTQDNGFLSAYRQGRLANHTRVLPPAKFIALVRAARAQLSINRVRGASSPDA